MFPCDWKQVHCHRVIPNDDVYNLPVKGVDGGEVKPYGASFTEEKERSLKFDHRHCDCWILMVNRKF